MRLVALDGIRCGVLWGLALLACPQPPSPIDDNRAPVARLVLPQIGVAGTAVDVDATDSADDDGSDLGFSFSFGDGTPEAFDDDGIFSHAWTAAGTFSVGVRVRDERAFEARTEAVVVIVDGVAEGCSCAAPCLDGGLCTARGCLVAASSSPDEDPAFDDEVSCL